MSSVLVSLRIAGRNVRINVPASEKDLVEQAAAILNEKIDSMSGSSMDAETRLVLSALSVCGDYLRLQQQKGEQIGTIDDTELADRLEALSARLEAAADK